MGLTQHQINSLITGVALAAEIPASSSKLRHFVVIKGYAIDEHGKRQRLSNALNSNKAETAFFLIRDYELQALYLENGYDLTEQDCENYSYIDNLKGIANAEAELIKHIKDFTLLVAEWKCDNPL